MIIDPQVAIDNDFILGAVNSYGVEVTLKEVEKPIMEGRIGVKESNTDICTKSVPRNVQDVCQYKLKKGCVYMVKANEELEVPDDAMVQILPTATMIKCGLFVASGWYSTREKGPIKFCIHCANDVIIERDAPIAKLIFHQKQWITQ